MEAQGSQLAYANHYSSAPLRILIDGRKLGDGGIGVYVDTTLRGLLRRDDLHLTVIASPDQASHVSWANKVEWIYDCTKPYSLAEYLLLPRRIDFSRFDLFHTPHYTLPFGIPIPSVVTIHDLIHIERPEKFYYPLIARRLISSAVKRAAAVITVSKDTERAVKQHVGVGKVNIHVIPNPMPQLDDASAVTSTTSPADAQQENKGPYFVSVVSNLKPHKGVVDLLETYYAARQQYEARNPEVIFPSLRLVGYGAEDLNNDPVLRERVAQISGVSVLGAVTPQALKELYSRAEAVVVPSLAEGFCLPALEAQSVGTRVVCRPVPALCELVSSRDLIAADFSRKALENVLLEVATNPCVNRSIDTKHLARFELDTVTAQLVSVYHSVVPALLQGAVA